MNRVPLACTPHQISKRCVKSVCIFFIHSHPPMAFVVLHTFFFRSEEKFLRLVFFFPTRMTCCRRTFKEKKQTSSLVSLSATIISHSQATCLQSERLEHAIGIAKYSYCMTVQTKKTMSSFVSPTIALLNMLYRRGRLHLDPSVFVS